MINSIVAVGLKVLSCKNFDDKYIKIRVREGGFGYKNMYVENAGGHRSNEKFEHLSTWIWR